jgi:hypothetical protein
MPRTLAAKPNKVRRDVGFKADKSFGLLLGQRAPAPCQEPTKPSRRERAGWELGRPGALGWRNSSACAVYSASPLPSRRFHQQTRERVRRFRERERAAPLGCVVTGNYYVAGGRDDAAERLQELHAPTYHDPLGGKSNA